MSSYQRKSLAPHIPLRPGAAEYIPRPDRPGDEIADWVLSDRSPVLIGGPAGVGKSTELARAAEALQPHRVACLIPLDRWENMRRLTADQLLLRIAKRVAYVATEKLKIGLSSDLQGALDQTDALEDVGSGVLGTYDTSPAALARYSLVEVARKSAQRKVTLLIDGLEKVPYGPGAMELFDALGQLPTEVELVTVVPWHAAFGPHADVVLRPGERFIGVRGV